MWDHIERHKVLEGSRKKWKERKGKEKRGPGI